MLKSRRGGAMIYVLLSIPILLTMAAFVINLSITYNAVEQAKSYTRLLSLNALEQYYEVVSRMPMGDGSVNLNELSAEVKDRVNLIAKQNRFSGHKEKEFLDFAFSWDANKADAGGILTPGTYYFASETPIPQCSATPCFVPAKAADLASDRAALDGVNAFKVEGRYVESLPMKFLASFLGDGGKDIRTCAFSTAVKRNLIFAVDISGTSAAETHSRIETTAQIAEPDKGRGGFYSFPVDVISAAQSLSANMCYVTDAPSTSEFRTSRFCHWHFLKNYVSGQAGPPYNGPAESRPPGENKPLKHYYQDYVPGGNEFTARVTVTGPENDGVYGEDTDYEEADLHPAPEEFPNPSLVGRDFFIDRYTKPEPLTSIFNAIVSGIKEFKARDIPGDKAGYIFIAELLTWTRIVKLTDQINYLEAIAYNTNRSFGGTVAPIREKYGIFPSGLPNEDHTDLYIAFSEAVKQLKANKAKLNGAPSLDGLVYIGDFLPNCVAKKYLVGLAVCASCENACNCAPGDQACLSVCSMCNAVCNDRTCKDDYTHYSAAIAELWDLVSSEMIPNQITLNIVLVGKESGPHTMDIVHPDPSENGRCLTEDEARKLALDYVKGGNKEGLQPADPSAYYSGRSSEFPFYQAGYDAYKMVRATGGIYLPVLQKPWNCVPDNSCTNGKRREVDRECRTQQQQLSGYLTDIVGTGNPFKIVNTNCDFEKYPGSF